MLKRIYLFFLLSCVIALPVSGENAPKLMTRQTSAYFGTVSALFLYESPENSSHFEQTWAQVKSILDEVERSVSVSMPDSDIARFNALPSKGTM